MNWTQLLSTQRFRPQDGEMVPTHTPASLEGVDALRTDFHIDYDRVVFSSAFRRLGRKTQVHPFAKHDHTHNRLTHSVEVASVGRSLGNRVGMMLQAQGCLPSGITAADMGMVVQVACLAHDLGNPPFGHTGEDALRDWCRAPHHQHYWQHLSLAERCDVQTYEGNAHSLRMVASLEIYRQRGGMRLTAAVVGALLKYPWSSTHAQAGGKFNVYQTELPFIRRVAAELGLPELQLDVWARHPLSYLMEAADDICYALLDLEDAVELELLEARVVEQVFAGLASLNEMSYPAATDRQRCAMLRGLAIGRAIEDVAQTFMAYQTDLLQGTLPAKDLLALCSPAVQTTLHEAKELARQQVFNHPSKLMLGIAAFPCLGSILDLLVPAVYAFITQGQVSAQQGLALRLLHEDPISPDDGLYHAYMKALDFVGGLTDNAAAKMARELSGIGMV